MDQILEPFVNAIDADADARLGDLLGNVASPIVRLVVGKRLGSSCADGDDVTSQVLMQLVIRLRRRRTDEDLGDIHRFANYAAVAAHHGCDHYLRRKYPLRWRLRNRLRYVLEHDRRFGVWKTAKGTWVCGLAGWTDRAPTVAPACDRLPQASSGPTRHFLRDIFKASEGPLLFSVVVDVAAALWRVPLREHEDNVAIEEVPDSASRRDAELIAQRTAALVWEEIRELPPRQRQALLLNLKDDAIGLFLVTGTTSLRDIAEALEMTVEALAALWNDLPLADSTVAIRLRCTRQQVINLRMAARKRLGNRATVWA